MNKEVEHSKDTNKQEDLGFEKLLMDMIEGELSPAQMKQLQAYLKNPKYQQLYETYIDLHAELEFEYSKENSNSQVAFESPSNQRDSRSKILSPQFAIPALLAAAAVIILLFVNTDKQPSQSPSPVAKINRSLDAEYTTSSQFAKDSIFELEKGIVELQVGETQIILEAPAKVKFADNSNIRLIDGKAVVQTPNNEASFTLHTEHLQLSNLGLEFCVESSKLHTTVHTSKGGVRSRGKAGETVLEQTEGLKIEADQETRIASRPELFIRALPGTNPEAPDFIHWSFDTHDSNKVPSRSKGMPTFAAQIHSKPVFEDAVFNQGITLDGNDDFLSTEYPGIGGNDPRTVAFWVKIPKGAKIENAISMLAWGSYKGSGNTFQISWNWQQKNGLLGALRAGLFHGQIVGSTDLRDGEWHHLAVVTYGGDKADVSTHILLYLDGQLHSTSAKSVLKIDTDTSSKKAIKLLMGRAADNYFDNKKPKTFKGSLDELYIFNGALRGEQIRSLMKNNRLK